MTASIAVLNIAARVLDNNGRPVSGGSIEFYEAGTTTPRTVYADSDLGTPLGTSVDLDSGGYPVTGGGTRTMIYTGTTNYKAVILDALGASIVSHDDIPGALAIVDDPTNAIPRTPVSSKTSSYTIVSGDRGKIINANPTSGALTVTLPSAVTVGDSWKVAVRHDGTANYVTVATVGSQSISYQGGAPTSVVLGLRGQSIWLTSDGSNWIVDADAAPYIGQREDVTPSEFAGADDTEKFNAAAAYANTNGLWLDLEGRTWTTGADGVLGAYKMRNGTINIQAVTNSRLVPADGGSYPIGVFLDCGLMFSGGWPVTTATAPSKGDTSITVASTSGFAVGDEILIHKPTQWGNSSSAGYFSEAASVIEVTSGTVLRVAGGLRQGYTTGTGTVTVRKYPEVDVNWIDVKIIGNQSVDGVFGAMITHARFASFTRCRVEAARRSGIATFGCRSASFTDCEFERCDQSGFGYAIVTNSTDQIKVNGGFADRCREGIAGGASFGIGRGLTWSVQVVGWTYRGGTDAAINLHPGGVSAVVDNCTIDMDPSGADEWGIGATATGDAILLQSQTFMITNCIVNNMRRSAVSWQPVDPGDTTLEMSLHVTNLKTSSTSTAAVQGFAVAASFASATSASKCNLISIVGVNSDTNNGINVNYYDTQIERVSVDNCRIKATGSVGTTLDGGVVKISSSYATPTRAPKSVSVANSYIESPTTTSGYYCIHMQGVSGSVFRHVAVSGVTTKGGQYGILGEYVTELDRWSHRSISSGSGAALAGTGCTINSTHSD